MTRSLRSRLTISLVAVLVVSLGTLALVVHAVIDHALERHFDGRLLDDAIAVAGMSEDEGGAPEFESESMPDFERADRPAYFEAWLDDGRVLARSPSLGAGDLQHEAGPASGPTFARCRLPDGRTGRCARLRQPLRIEADATVPGAKPRPSTRFVTVAVARGTEELAETLASVRAWLAFLATLTLLGASGVTAAAVSHGLRSTRALGAQIAGLDAKKLGRVEASEALPAELVPLVEKINMLLERVEASLEREKRFTADVSHELRTPLAALRTTLDVVGSRDRTAPELRQALADVNTVVRQMQALCDNLLGLARLDAGRVPVNMSEVKLHALVEECWSPLAASARARELRFHNDIAREASTLTDPEQLRVVVTNLLSNAVSYTARGGEITVRKPNDTTGGVLEVHDSGPAIAEALLPRIFERFSRGDPARSDGLHCGIGLALVHGLAEILDLDVTASNTPEGGVSFALARSPPGLSAGSTGTRHGSPG
jgi:two-component system sensor histidine kinase QseC